VAIKASSSREVDALVADLSSGSAVARDAAVARLTVIGARAVARLAALADSGAVDARIAALRALEGIGDPRGVDAALRSLADADPQVATAAVLLARRFLQGSKSAAIVDRLTAVAVDGTRPDAVRVAAVRALKALDPQTIAPLLDALAKDASAVVRSEARPAPKRGKPAAVDPVAELTRVAESGVPEDAAALQKLLADGGSEAPLAVVMRIVERARDREAAEPAAARPQWATVRAQAHLALARRGSRLALYDLRESLERSADPLPVDALAALSLIGDASCLEPIAAARTRSKDRWWRDHLTDAFRTIAAREGITRRHAVMKRIAKRWPALVLLLYVAAATAVRAQAPRDDDAWLQRLQHWTVAIDRHEDGAIDDVASEVAAWSIAEVQSLLLDVKLLVFVMRHGTDPNEFRASLPDKRGGTASVRWRFISRPAAELLRTLAHDEARRGDANRVLKRGAMLHSDIAMLTAAPEAPARGGGSLRPRRLQMHFADGRGLAVTDTTPHWNIARGLLDDVLPSPAQDDMVRHWYQATLAFQQDKEQLDVGHTERALALFQKDPDILFFGACLHETFATPATHDALRVMSPPSGWRLDVNSSAGELRQAERLFRQTLAEQPDLVEARIRLGRVLGLSGRHGEAVQELRRAIGAATEPLLLYYEHLFIGAELTALDRLDEARSSYERAAALFPLAQSPRLALSLLARRRHDLVKARQALDDVLAALEPDDRDDPWWRYHRAQGRTADARLAALRQLVPISTP
jgi:HEAT repeat protein